MNEMLFVPAMLLIAFASGVLVCYMLLRNTRNGKIKAEYEQKIAQINIEHRDAVDRIRKESNDKSRSVIKGQVAEQFAPMLPEFDYLPSDAKFLGDPIDYVIFDGYNDFRDTDEANSEINIIFMDIKSGKSRLTHRQKAIANAIRQGRVRFEVLHVAFDDED